MHITSFRMDLQASTRALLTNSSTTDLQYYGTCIIPCCWSKYLMQRTF